MLSHAVLAAALPALPALVHKRGGSNKVLHLEAFFGRPLHMRSQPCSFAALLFVIRETNLLVSAALPPAHVCDLFRVRWPCGPVRAFYPRAQTAARDSRRSTALAWRARRVLAATPPLWQPHVPTSSSASRQRSSRTNCWRSWRQPSCITKPPLLLHRNLSRAAGLFHRAGNQQQRQSLRARLCRRPGLREVTLGRRPLLPELGRLRAPPQLLHQHHWRSPP